MRPTKTKKVKPVAEAPNEQLAKPVSPDRGLNIPLTLPGFDYRDELDESLGASHFGSEWYERRR